MSLSKLGLPAANAIVHLANGGVGQLLVTPLIQNGEILRISEEYIHT